jgi:outer membrane protein assembly factor BamB
MIFSRLPHFALIAVLATSLSGCSLWRSFVNSPDSEIGAAPGERVKVIEEKSGLTVAGATDFNFGLPPRQNNREWPNSLGSYFNMLQNPNLADSPAEIETIDIGRGSSRDFKLISKPVIGTDRIFTIDAEGTIKAFAVSNNETLWSFDTTPKDRNDEAMGGGLAVYGDTLYATTGFGEVMALDVVTGGVRWRKSFSGPFRAAPTIYENRVFAVTLNNELIALSRRDGSELWRHTGIAEGTALMGAASPTVNEDMVFVAYSSGELFALRQDTGRVLWSEILAVPTTVGALPAMADIRGQPVVNRDRLYAVSHSGRTISFDIRRGERAFELEAGGTQTPWIAGNVLYMVTNDNQLLALDRETGKVLWAVALQKLEDPEDRDSRPLFWQGPVIAGNRLLMTNSNGMLAEYNPETGTEMRQTEFSDGFYLPPIVAGGRLYLLTDNGRLHVWQ